MNRTKLTRKEKVQMQEDKKRIEQSKLKFKGGIWLLSIGTIFFLLFGGLWMTRNSEISIDQIQTIEVNASKQAEKKWVRRIGHNINMTLIEYPNKEFKVGRLGANSVDIESLNTAIDKNSKFEIQILKKDWADKAKKNTFFIYGIRKDKKEYFNIDTYNSLRKKDRNSLANYALILWSICMIAYGVKILLKNRIPADNIRL